MATNELDASEGSGLDAAGTDWGKQRSVDQTLWGTKKGKKKHEEMENFGGVF